MKKVYVYSLLLIGLWHCGVSHAQKTYKGSPKHPAPGIPALPSADRYRFEQPLPNPLRSKLDSSLTALIDKGTLTAGIGVTLSVPGKGSWHAEAGRFSSQRESSMTHFHLFYWASVGKLVTGTVIAQLIHEKKISPTDPLSLWYPAFPNANRITLYHLLTHTGGLYSFNHDSTFHYNTRYYTPDELLTIALAKEPLFSPGEYWSYSNTGYLLLALIAEKTEHKPFAQIVKERIATPLSLPYLKILAPGELPTNLAPAHSPDSLPVQDYSVPLGAGNLVARPEEMAKFLLALLSGEFIPKKELRHMLRHLYPMHDQGQYYGQGIMFYDFAAIDHSDNRWIGHSGGTETYRAILAYDLKSKAVIALAVNEAFPVEALAYQWLKWVQKSP